MAEYRSTKELRARMWSEWDKDTKAVVAQDMGDRYGMYWGDEEFYEHLKELGIVEKLNITIVPQEYGDIDPARMAEDATWDKFGEVISEDVQALASMIWSPLDTTMMGWDIMTGMSRRGKGFHEVPGIAEKKALADAVVNQLKYQASPQGIQENPIRSAVTGAQLLPTGPLVAGTKGLSMINKIARAAHTASQAVGLDPLAGLGAGYGLARGVGRRLGGGGGVQSGVAERIASSVIPTETVGPAASVERVPGHVTEVLGGGVSMAGGMPVRTVPEALNIAGKPASKLRRSGGFLGDRIRKFQTWTSGKRIEELTMRIHQGVDKLDDAASEAYTAGMNALGSKLDATLDVGTFMNIVDTLEGTLERAGIKFTSVKPPDPPKGRPKPPEPINVVKVEWDNPTVLEPFLKNRRGEFERVVAAIVNANNDGFGSAKPVTLREVYKIRREVDQLYRSFGITEDMTSDARRAFQEVRSALQEQLGTLLGPEYNVVMKEYMNHVDLLENLEETMGVSPYKVKKAGTEVRKLEKGTIAAVYPKLKGLLDQGDLARRGLDHLYDLQKRIGVDDLVPLLIASVSNAELANNLVARHAIIGSLGLGAFGGGLEFGSPTMLVAGATAATASLLMMNPRFLIKIAASRPQYERWVARNKGRVAKFIGADKGNESVIRNILSSAVRYGWDAGRVINQLEENIPKEKKQSLQAALRKAIEAQPPQTDLREANIRAYSGAGTY